MQEETKLKTVVIIMSLWLIGNFIIIPVIMALTLKYTRWKEAKRRAKANTPQAGPPPPEHFNCRCKVVQVSKRSLSIKQSQLN